MAGRLGGKRITIRKLTVVRVDSERNLLLIKELFLVSPVPCSVLYLQQ
jgi:hypothetical protein